MRMDNGNHRTISDEGVNMIIKYTLDQGAYPPERAHEWDAGFDLRIPRFHQDVYLSGRSNTVIDTGVHVAIPKGYVGFLKSKSGLNVNCHLNGEGVIDAGYTGSIKVKMYNHGGTFDYHQFKPGDKLIQLVILPIPEIEMVQVKSLEQTDRGDNGFGSSGR